MDAAFGGMITNFAGIEANHSWLDLWLFCRWDLLQGGRTCWRTEAEVRRVSTGAGCWVDDVGTAYGWVGTHGSRWLGLESFPSS
ncbi:hypothetical protein Dimus_002967 [Dionaea muscipula]